jgi:hypothetical protein
VNVELPGAVYLYTLATLAMTFAGFCAIVIVLRQTTGKRISGFHIVLTRLYLESGLFAAAFCMLPPLFAVFDHSRSRWLGVKDLIAEPEGPTFISRTVARRRLDRLRS